MIDGLHFDVSSDELRKHLLERISLHRTKMDDYKKRVEIMNIPEDDFRDLEQTTLQDPASQLRRKYRHHKNRFELFLFMHAHVIEDKYRLSEGDLLTLEFISKTRF